jgi:hypothetical protein
MLRLESRGMESKELDDYAATRCLILSIIGSAASKFIIHSLATLFSGA